MVSSVPQAIHAKVDISIHHVCDGIDNIRAGKRLRQEVAMYTHTHIQAITLFLCQAEKKVEVERKLKLIKVEKVEEDKKMVIVVEDGDDDEEEVKIVEEEQDDDEVAISG